MKGKLLGSLLMVLSMMFMKTCSQSSTMVLASVTPNFIQTGSPDTQLKLVGSGFVNPTTAVWQSTSLTALQTRFLDSKDLVAIVPSSLLKVAGTAKVFAAQGAGQNQTVTQSLTITIGNVAPTLVGCAPCHVVVGAASPTITLTGTNFNSSSVVNWTNGTTTTPLATTFVSPTGLTAVVPTSLYPSAGVAKLSVVNSGPGGGTSQQLSFTVVAQLTITTAALPSGTVGTAYSATLQATGGTTPYTWSISSGSLPSGLTLNGSTGVISGTPTSTGSTSFTVQVVDSTGSLARKVIR